MLPYGIAIIQGMNYPLGYPDYLFPFNIAFFLQIREAKLSGETVEKPLNPKLVAFLVS
jgi:hypothetical protein